MTVAGEIAEKAAKDAAEKAAKDAAEKAAKDAAEKAAKDAAEKAAKDAAEKAAKDAAEKAAKEASIKGLSKFAKYSLTAAGIAGLGFGLDVTKKATDNFNKRDGQYFTVTFIKNDSSISTNDANIIVNFTNPNSIKMYPGEDIELSETNINIKQDGTFGNINGRFEIKKVINTTTILIIKIQNIETADGEAKGKMILHADIKNDLNDAAIDDLNKIEDLAPDLPSFDWLYTSLKVIGAIIILCILIFIATKIKQIIRFIFPSN